MPYFDASQTRGSRHPAAPFHPRPIGTNARALVPYLDHLLSLMARRYDLHSRIQFEVNLERLKAEIQFLAALEPGPSLQIAHSSCTLVLSDVNRAFGSATAGHGAKPGDPHIASAREALADVGRRLDQTQS